MASEVLREAPQKPARFAGRPVQVGSLPNKDDRRLESNEGSQISTAQAGKVSGAWKACAQLAALAFFVRLELRLEAPQTSKGAPRLAHPSTNGRNTGKPHLFVFI